MSREKPKLNDAYVALPPLPGEQADRNGDETDEQYHTLLEVDSHVLERTKNRCERKRESQLIVDRSLFIGAFLFP